jgi:kinesin family protein C2/C3
LLLYHSLVIHSNEKPRTPSRLSTHFRRLHSGSPQQPKESAKGSVIPSPILHNSLAVYEATKERFDTLQKDLVSLRMQFGLVRHTSIDDISLLRRQSEEWSKQASRAIAAATAETDTLREKFAAESAMRLKLLNSLQDIRGTVRVYCRPKPNVHVPGGGTSKSILKIPTHDILVLNEDTSPISFKYDRVFPPGASQYEVFSELEEPLISSLDGFNVTLLAFGQGGSGKTHTLLGDLIMDEDGNDLPFLKSYGVQPQAIQQLFTIAGHRTDRYKDAFSMTMVEVHNEKLFDLVSGTPSAEQDGEAIMCETRDRRDKRRETGSEADWRKGKLEIRTNIDGNTVVQGLVSIPIKSFEDVLKIWQESIANRAERLRRQGSDWKKHGRKTNVITTIHITSVNIATGVGTEGRLQFVDMAASDIAQGVGKVKENSDIDSCVEADDTQFANKSIDAFNEVINARCQFDRSVPYRNSTLTHLLRDSLEADTKVLLLCCINSDECNMADTVGALRFASRMQKVSIGKATKHVTGSKE